MILQRYITREISKTLIAVVLVLLLVLISNQLVRYLNAAAAGSISGSILFKVILYQVPELLGLLLPMALFLALMLTLGRLYCDSEMTVMIACGVGQRKLFNMLSTVILMTFIITALLNLWLSPLAIKYRHLLLSQAGYATLANTIQPGRFQQSNGGHIVAYVQGISSNHKQMNNVFIAEELNTAELGQPPNYQWAVLSAKSGGQFIEKQTGKTYLVAKDGYRYQGVPGHGDYRIGKFAEYGVLVGDFSPMTMSDDSKSMSSVMIWALRNSNSEAQAEWQWRISLPLSVLLLALLAIPIAKVAPRQGRYHKILLALLLYTLYANMLFVSRSWLKGNILPFWLGMWWVHVAMLLLIIIVWLYNNLYYRRRIMRCLQWKFS